MNNAIMIDGKAGSIGAGGTVDFGAPETMHVFFLNKSIPDIEESRRRGRRWDKSVPHVHIQHPGEKDYVERPLKENDIAIMRWPRQYEAYLKKQEAIPDGTPIDVLFPEEPQIPANLKSIAIYTVEQLAGLTAHGLQTVGMGATQWQQRAKSFLEAANGGKGMHKLRLENERQANTIEVLSNQVALMKAQLEKLAAQVTNKLGANMIPNMPAPIAQAHAQVLHETYEPLPELSDEPLFVAVADAVEGPAIEQLAVSPPKRRGRPPRQA